MRHARCAPCHHISYQIEGKRVHADSLSKFRIPHRSPCASHSSAAAYACTSTRVRATTTATRKCRESHSVVVWLADVCFGKTPAPNAASGASEAVATAGGHSGGRSARRRIVLWRPSRRCRWCAIGMADPPPTWVFPARVPLLSQTRGSHAAILAHSSRSEGILASQTEYPHPPTHTLSSAVFPPIRLSSTPLLSPSLPSSWASLTIPSSGEQPSDGTALGSQT